MAFEPDASAAKARADGRLSLARILPLVAIVGAAVLVFAMGWHRELSLEALASHRAALDSFIKSHFTPALLAYVGIYILSAALSVPGGLFLTVTGGILFGWVTGGLAATVGATVGATCLFLLVRYGLADFVRARMGPRIASITEGFRADALSYLLFLRLVPAFPFFLVNLAAALAAVPLHTFLLTTLVGILPATFAFAIFGAGIDSALTRDEHPLGPGLLAALTALGAAVLVPAIVRRLRTHRSSTARPADGERDRA